MRLDHDVDRAFEAHLLDPLTARLTVGKRQEREPHDLGLCASTADPAVQLAVLGHKRPVADARADDGRSTPTTVASTNVVPLLTGDRPERGTLTLRAPSMAKSAGRRSPPDARAPAERTAAFRAQSNAYCSYSSTLSFVTTAAGTTTCRGTSGGTSSEKLVQADEATMFTALAAMFGL